MSPRRGKTKLFLTNRALSDIAEIESYSVTEWGKQTAEKYIGDIEAALVRLQEQPSLLRGEADFHPQLCFYRVNKHLLVCDLQPEAIFVITVVHASRDIPTRLAELQPTLVAETELLHRRLEQSKKRRK